MDKPDSSAAGYPARSDYICRGRGSCNVHGLSAAHCRGIAVASAVSALTGRSDRSEESLDSEVDDNSQSAYPHWSSPYRNQCSNDTVVAAGYTLAAVALDTEDTVVQEVERRSRFLAGVVVAHCHV